MLYFLPLSFHNVQHNMSHVECTVHLIIPSGHLSFGSFTTHPSEGSHMDEFGSQSPGAVYLESYHTEHF